MKLKIIITFLILIIGVSIVICVSNNYKKDEKLHKSLNETQERIKTSENAENNIKIRYAYAYSVDTADTLNEIHMEQYGKNYIDILEFYVTGEYLEEINDILNNISFEKVDLSKYKYTNYMIGVEGQYEVTINNNIVLLMDEEYSLYIRGDETYIIYTPKALGQLINKIVQERAFGSQEIRNIDKITIISKDNSSEIVNITNKSDIDYLKENLRYAKIDMRDEEMGDTTYLYIIDLNNGMKIKVYSFIGYITDGNEEYYVAFISDFNEIVSKIYDKYTSSKTTHEM